MDQPSTSKNYPSHAKFNNNSGEPNNAFLDEQLSDDQRKRLDVLMKKVEHFGKFGNGSSTSGFGRNVDECFHFDRTPDYLKCELRDYQIRGLNWLVWLYKNNTNGILADEMGLGKTIQAISILGYLKFFEKIDGPFLIVVPKSTIVNWLNEFRRFCPTITAIKLIGDKKTRKETIQEMRNSSEWDVCVTSYDVLILEMSLKHYNWRYIIIDEAHRIKNENSKLSQFLRDFESSNRLLLTGTPLQNNLHEFWALLNYLLPDIFGSASDFDTFFDSNDCLRGNVGIVQRLHAIMKPFMLRRVKAEVEKTLLPKIELKLFVGLTKLQRDTYIKVLRKEVIQFDSFGNARNKQLNMIIQELRKAAYHPYLVDNIEPPPFTTGEHLITCCGKMMVLDKLLFRLKSNGSRVLIFSQFVRMLDILEDFLEFRGHKFYRLDGSTSYEQRANDIEQFNAENSDVFVYLISTRAGGLGINLATADTVIIYDSDWNPQSDSQAIDRVHRIGQTKQVRVFRLVTENTVDERIVQRAEIKSRLEDMVIKQGQNTDGQSKVLSKSQQEDIIRFGMDSIMANESPVTDVDIDEIMKYGEKKMAAENKKHDAKLNENRQRNMTLEEASSVSVFQFDGIDYRLQQSIEHSAQLSNIRLTQNNENTESSRHSVVLDRFVHLSVHKFYPLQLLKMCNTSRTLNMSTDTAMKEELLKKGFTNWSEEDYKLFCDAVLEFGRNDCSNIAKQIPNMTLADVIDYHKVFFERGPTESDEIRRVIKLVNFMESNDWNLFVEKASVALEWKMSQYRHPKQDLMIDGRDLFAGPKFRLDCDRYLLCAVFKHGLSTKKLYGLIKNEIQNSESKLNFFQRWEMRPKYRFELQQRVHCLLDAVSKEYDNYVDKENKKGQSSAKKRKLEKNQVDTKPLSSN